MTSRFRTDAAGTANHCDGVLVAKTLNGERAAFGLLIERYRGKVYNRLSNLLSWCEDLEDLVQETFCKAYQSLSRLRCPDHFAPWLMCIATNKAKDWLRRRQLRRQAEERGHLHHLYEPAAETQADILAQSELVARLRRALDRLAPAYREIVVLRFMEGYSYGQIAQTQGISPATVRWRLRRAQQLLSRVLRDTRIITGLGSDRHRAYRAGSSPNSTSRKVRCQ